MITQEDINAFLEMAHDSDNPVMEQEHDGMANDGSSEPLYYEWKQND